MYKATAAEKEKDEGKVLRGQEEFADSLKIFEWNKLLMSTLGLWPASPSNFIFFLCFGYFSYQMILEYLDLFLFIDDPVNVILNLTENLAFSQIFVRILMLRLYNQELGQLIEEANKDFDANDYTDEERNAFIAYHVKSRIFFKFLITNTALTASSYYMKPLLGLIVLEWSGSKNENATLIFLLPYRFYTFYELNEASTYFWTYASQLPFVFVSGFGQSAADCLMVTLVYHLSGQMAVLAMRITNLSTDSCNCTQEIQKIVQQHTSLLRMGNVIRKVFSVMLLGNLLSATSLICILGYEILMNLSNGDRTVLVSLFAFIFLVLLVLYAHCTIGETLITESARVCEAYYNCSWYNMSEKNAKIIILCMARSQKPLQLTAGKFSMFCLATFTSSIKTSMGYLSVLRTVMM